MPYRANGKPISGNPYVHLRGGKLYGGASNHARKLQLIDGVPHGECGMCHKFLPFVPDVFRALLPPRSGLADRCRECDKTRLRANHHRVAYGMGPGDYEELLVSQGGRCVICGTDKPGGSATRFHIDHDHFTGSVRGLLCHLCNIGLGSFDDDPQRLMNAATYLRQTHLREVI